MAELYPVTGIITHPAPHLDEDAAIEQLYEFGESKYPGVRKAIREKKIEFLRGKSLKMSGEDYLLKEGKLCLGVGGGRFDEHGSDSEDRKEGECCATLVAKDLGTDTHPYWRFLLGLIKNTDLNPNASVLELSTLVKCMNEAHPDDPFLVIEWARTAIKAFVRQQKEFHQARKVVREGVIESVFVDRKKPIKMLSVRTDCTAVGKFNRSKDGPKASVLVQQNSRGQVQIFLSGSPAVTLDGVIQALRLKEQSLAGRVDETDPAKLCREGTLDCAPEWHYSRKAGQILNGALTYKDAPATKIPFDEILDIIRTKLSLTSE